MTSTLKINSQINTSNVTLYLWNSIAINMQLYQQLVCKTISVLCTIFVKGMFSIIKVKLVEVKIFSRIFGYQLKLLIELDKKTKVCIHSILSSGLHLEYYLYLGKQSCEKEAMTDTG